MNMSNVNTPKLRSLYANDPAAKVALDTLGARQSDATSTSKMALMNMAKLDSAKALALLREFEACGCGRFFTGRRGKATRIEWSVPTRALVMEVAPDDGTLAADLPATAAGGNGSRAAGVIVHPYHLRPGLQIQIELPGDLSQAEAGRLADFIKTLPF